MLIQELTREECLDLLDRAHLGRLACACETQPYIVPIYFAYDNDYLYSFSTVGQKIEWMRANPNVCVETDEVTNSRQWLSVVVLGRYEELPDTPEWHNTREYAHRKLRATQPCLVGAWLRENITSRHRKTADAGLLPYSHRAGYRSSR